jgi:hypothetical protein
MFKQLANAMFLECAYSDYLRLARDVGDEPAIARADWARNVGGGLLYWRARYAASNLV